MSRAALQSLSWVPAWLVRGIRVLGGSRDSWRDCPAISADQARHARPNTPTSLDSKACGKLGLRQEAAEPAQPMYLPSKRDAGKSPERLGKRPENPPARSPRRTVGQPAHSRSPRLKFVLSALPVRDPRMRAREVPGLRPTQGFGLVAWELPHFDWMWAVGEGAVLGHSYMRRDFADFILCQCQPGRVARTLARTRF